MNRRPEVAVERRPEVAMNRRPEVATERARRAARSAALAVACVLPFVTGAPLAIAMPLAGGAPAARQGADVDERARDDSERTRDDALAALTEAFELGLLDEALALTDDWPGGAAALARDGAAGVVLARVEFALGRADAARARLEAVAADDPARADAVAELAALDVEADRLDAAIARLTDETGAPRGDLASAPRAAYTLGRALVRAGRDADARAPLEAFVATWPRHPDAPAAWHMLAQEALARRDVDRARACRATAAELGRWHAYYRTRRLQRRAAPDAPEPRVGLAQLWIAAREYDRARAELAPVLERSPDYCPAWTTLGELERKAARVAEARVAYDRALACDPTAPLPRFAAAALALEANDDAIARAHLEHLCGSDAADEARYRDAHLWLARLLLADGDGAAAAARYATYRELGGEESLRE